MSKNVPTGASGKDKLHNVRETLQREVEAEFMRYLENMRTRLLVADVENSLHKYADKYSDVISDLQADMESENS